MSRKDEKRPEYFEGNPNDPQGMAVLVNAYLEAIAVKGFSEQTLQLRRMHLNRFIRWAALVYLDRRGCDTIIGY